MLHTMKKFLAFITTITTLAFTNCYAAPGAQSSQQSDSAPQKSTTADDRNPSDEVIQVHPLHPSHSMDFKPFVPAIPLGDSPPLTPEKHVPTIPLGDSPPLTEGGVADAATNGLETASPSISSDDEEFPEHSRSSVSFLPLEGIGIELPGSTEEPSNRILPPSDLDVKTLSLRGLLRAYSEPRPLSPSSVKCACVLTSELLKKDPPILSINDDPMVVGDLHGNFNAARCCCERFLSTVLPNGRSIIFLGDYVDRGPQSIKTLMLLLSLKRLFPDKVFLLRGNHEARGQECCTDKTLFAECNRDFTNGQEIYDLIQDSIFNNLSIAAVVNNKYFCVHGGIPCEIIRGMVTSDTIDRIKKPILLNPDATLSNDEKLIHDILWRDPLPKGESPFADSPRGPNVLYYSREEEMLFLERFGLKQIIRGHEWVKNSGYKLDLDDTVITIFSSPHYGLARDIGGGVLDIIGGKVFYSSLPPEAEENR